MGNNFLESIMAFVTQIHTNESVDSMLRRFRKIVDKQQIITEFTSRQYYEKPSEAKRRKQQIAKRRQQKQTQQNMLLKNKK